MVEVRGAGLLIGVVLAEPVAKAVEKAARDAGVLVNAAAPDVVRLAPPLILSAAEAEDGIVRLSAAISASLPGSRVPSQNATILPKFAEDLSIQGGNAGGGTAEGGTAEGGAGSEALP